MEVSAANSLRSERVSGCSKSERSELVERSETVQDRDWDDRDCSRHRDWDDRDCSRQRRQRLTGPFLLLSVCLFVCTTKGHLVDPEGTESSHHRGTLCAQLIKNTGLLLDPELIKEGLGAAPYRDKRYCCSPAFLDAVHIKKGFFFLICLFKI